MTEMAFVRVWSLWHYPIVVCATERRARVTHTLEIADHNPNIAVSYTINGRVESPSIWPVWAGVSGVVDLGGVNLNTSHISVIPSLWIRSN